jgi:hypothetical protein
MRDGLSCAPAALPAARSCGLGPIVSRRAYLSILHDTELRDLGGKPYTRSAAIIKRVGARGEADHWAWPLVAVWPGGIGQ